jgi:membrane-bound serine protease (ClpP class)
MKKISLALAVLILYFLPLYAYDQIISIEVKDAIHPITAEYISDAIDKADREEAALLVIQLDTPGGLLESTKTIIQKFFQAKTPIVTYVYPSGARAASAGFMILIGSDVAVMAPSTNTGAAHPVLGLFGKQEADDVMLAKAESDAAAFVRGIAENRGRDVAEAEKAVKESTSYTEKEALEKNLIDLISRDIEELIASLDGKEIKRFDGSMHTFQLKEKLIENFEMNWRQNLLSIISQPIISYFLLLLGILGIYVEMTHPGVVFPGVVGVIALLLFAFSVQILPVNYIGILLIAFSVVLFILEIKVTSFGMLTLGGILCLIIGSLILFEGPIPELRLPFAIILPTALAIGAVMALIVWLVIKVHRKKAMSGREGLLYEIGVASTDLEPDVEGKVFVHGETWNAISKEKIMKGEKVKVSAVKEMNIEVEKIRRKP